MTEYQLRTNFCLSIICIFSTILVHYKFQKFGTVWFYNFYPTFPYCFRVICFTRRPATSFLVCLWLSKWCHKNCKYAADFERKFSHVSMPWQSLSKLCCDLTCPWVITKVLELFCRNCSTPEVILLYWHYYHNLV